MEVLIAEEILEAVFDTLPEIPGKGNDAALKPKFELGTQKDLLVFLNSEVKLKSYPYPLIFLETPILSKGNDQKIVFDCTLVIATKTKTGFTPRERLNETVRYRLKPTLQNVLIALNESGVTRIINKDEYTTETFYNYGSTPEDKDHKATDIWDAIRLKCKVEANNRCIRTINYEF